MYRRTLITVFLMLPLAYCIHLSATGLPPCINQTGFYHTDSHPWNACTRVVHGMKRVPIDDVQHVYLDPVPETSNDTYHGHTLALVPMKPMARNRYILVYFHGYNHQIVNGSPLTTPRLEYDRIAEQIQQSGHHHDLIGLFPQASTAYNFMKTPARVDFNVPLDGNYHITDTTRIDATIPTIKKILDDGGSVILMSHLGRPKGGPEEKYSLRHVLAYLSDVLKVPVKFADDCIGQSAVEQAASLLPGEVLLLENLRFYKEEEKGNEDFAKKNSTHPL